MAGYGIAFAMLSACVDPGQEALERLIRGTDALIELAEQHARGEVDGPALNAALWAWERTERAEIARLSGDAARALGPTLRATLEVRWRKAAERLAARLSKTSREFIEPE